MKKTLITAGLSLAMLMPSVASAADYTIDTSGAHASVNFKISHLGYSFIIGRFNTFSGSFSFDENDVEASKVSVLIDTTSVDTNHSERDKHIRSADFINTNKFAEARFTSTKVSKTEGKGLVIEGDLLLHGTTKPIVINAEFIGEGDDPWGGYRAGFTGTTRLELADFGIPALPASTYADMELHIEGIRN